MSLFVTDIINVLTPSDPKIKKNVGPDLLKILLYQLSALFVEHAPPEHVHTSSSSSKFASNCLFYV